MHSHRNQLISLATLTAMLALTAGCQLVVDFDRDKIPDGQTDAGPMDAGPDSGPPDAGPDSGLPECTEDNDCDDGDVCNGAETCDPGTHTCVEGTAPADGAECGPDMVCFTGDCITPECGNGVVEPGEQCDEDSASCTDTCQFTCTGDADCNDGNICNGVETCDLSTNTCLAGTAPADGTECGPDMVCFMAGCIEPECGNGVVEPGEQCDDGQNGDDTDGCTDACEFTCTEDADCAHLDTQCAVGECQDDNTCKAEAANENGACGDACMQGACAAGICTDMTPVCPDLETCTDGVCSCGGTAGDEPGEPACTGGAPYCQGEAQCVACLEHQHCAGNPAGSVCRADFTCGG